MFLLDCHCDTMTKLRDTGDELLRGRTQVSIEKLRNFRAPVMMFAICTEDKKPHHPFAVTNAVIDFFEEQIEKNSEIIAAAAGYEQVMENIRAGLPSAILALEGGEALEGSLENLRILYRRGVRMLTMTWNHRNCLGNGVMVREAGGLTEFGRRALSEMNRLGIAIDVSHLSEKGFWDVYEMSTQSFVASHSNCFRLCAHPRNLTDEQIKAIDARGGVIGVTLYPPFLCENGNAGLDDIIRHVDHMLSLVGENAVGIGTDFDGIDCTPEGFGDISRLPVLHEALRRQYGERIAEKIFGENFLRVLRGIWGAS